MSRSCTESTQVRAPAAVVQAVLQEAYAGGNLRDIEIRESGLSATIVDGNQIIRVDFAVRGNGMTCVLEQSMTFLQGQGAGSWLVMKPLVKRKIQENLISMKAQAESQV